MVKQYLVLLPIMLGIDMVWLGLVAKKFYDRQLAAFSRTLNLPAAVLVYLLIPLGIVLFVLPRAGGDKMMALLWGGIFGLVVYGVYDLTNFATLKDWTLTMTVVDMIWGAFICGVTSFLVTTILK
jgi:uncharacterized membrane protein